MTTAVKTVSIALPAFIVGYLAIAVLSLDVTPKVVTTYELPAFPTLSEISSLGYGDQAIFVGNNPVYSSSPTIRPTASTAKMILALAVMEKKPFNLGEAGETITIDQEDYANYNWYVNNNGSTTPVLLGGQLTQYEALVSVMLASSNNMADKLAIWAFGSIDEYRAYATDMLQRLGADNTNIGGDASGYSANTTSTASDLALIGQHLMRNPVLAEIVGTKQYSVPMAGILTNTNQLLGQDGVVGIKTGWIGIASGYCLVSAYEESGHIVTIALLGAPTRQSSFEDSRQIILALQEQLRPVELVAAGQEIARYDTWWAGQIAIASEEGLSELAWNGVEANFNIEGETLIINIGDKTTEVQARPTKEIPEPTFWQKLLRVVGVI